MKKVFLLSLFFIAVFFIGCAQKDKLTANTMILKIDAPGYSYSDHTLKMSANSTISVRAVIKNAAGKDINKSVTWSVADSSLASFSSNNSKETELTSKGTGSTDITLTCEGMQVTATLQIS
ncbi:hypothetical protein [Candidatus Ruminimicrobium bovinum]|uniref:hypothetical protein n=1 Tax=Candidatus Ruminimicrobium bovinum TaxID=3242779 RepID=UPI0039B8F87D